MNTEIINLLNIGDMLSRTCLFTFNRKTHEI